MTKTKRLERILAKRLSEAEEAAQAAVILKGPEPDRDGVCAWTRADLCDWLAARFGKTYHRSSMTRVLRRLGFSRQKARPVHAKADAGRRRRSKKKGLRAALNAAAAAHPGKRLQLWFQDEARIGNKGRVCHRWWIRGERAPGRCDRRYKWAYIFSAEHPATGADFRRAVYNNHSSLFCVVARAALKLRIELCERVLSIFSTVAACDEPGCAVEST